NSTFVEFIILQSTYDPKRSLWQSIFLRPQLLSLHRSDAFMRHSDPKPAATLSALTDDIQKRYADMSPQFQIGARYLLDYANEVAVKSMRQIAAQAGVQPATLVRLAQTLGYKGWGEL